MQFLWAALGLLCVGLAFVGIVLPLLPTVPFLLLAAFFFARSSTRLHNWLLGHRVFGSMIEDWHKSGAIRPAAKKAATISICCVFLLSIFLNAPTYILGIQFVVLTAVAAFIWTRPNG